MVEIKAGQKAIIIKNDGQHNFSIDVEVTFVRYDKKNDWYAFAGVNKFGEASEQFLEEDEFELKS